MKTLKLPYSRLEAIQDDNPVAFPTLEITENGKYNVRGYDYANVNVEGGGVTVEALSVTENGTYSEEGKAYSPVVVDVEGDLRNIVGVYNIPSQTVTTEFDQLYNQYLKAVRVSDYIEPVSYDSNDDYVLYLEAFNIYDKLNDWTFYTETYSLRFLNSEEEDGLYLYIFTEEAISITTPVIPMNIYVASLNVIELYTADPVFINAK